jgi:iron complex transport system permease protein
VSARLRTSASAGSGDLADDLADDLAGDLAAELRAVRAAARGPRRRARIVVGGLSVVLVGLVVAHVLLGDYTFTIPDFVRILGGADIPGASYILLESKLPRAAMAVLVGLAFGLSGALFQTTLRNPLASPDLVGVSMGASAAAVFAIVIVGSTGSQLSLWGLGGAVGVAVAIRLTAGPGPGYRLVLVGVTATFALQAVINYLFTRASVFDAQLALRWLTGSLNGANWEAVRTLCLCLAVLLPITAWLARALPLIELGDDVAAALGVRRFHGEALLLLGVLLTAVAVAGAGPVSFVPFLAGPIARALNGGRTSLTGAALAGAVIVVGADYATAQLLDANLPVGVVTGGLGAPFLLWLLVTGRSGRTTR